MNSIDNLETNQPQEIERKQSKQLISEIEFKGHKIQLISQKDAIPFTPEHIEQINLVLQEYWDIDPQIVQGYKQFISENKDNIPKNKQFPLNGENGPCIGKDKNDGYGAIYFTKRGMNQKIPHRVSSTKSSDEPGFVDNFSGTLAHELAHGTSTTHQDRPAGFIYDLTHRNEFYSKWQTLFGWKHKIIDKKVEFSTSQPEKCIGGVDGYASTRPEEDINDSLTAYILNPNALHPEKKELFKQTVKKIQKPSKPATT